MRDRQTPPSGMLRRTPHDTPPLTMHRLAMCGVFDGHAGRNAAAFASERLPEAVAPALVRAHCPEAQPAIDGKAARRAIVDGFAATDTALLEAATKHGVPYTQTTFCTTRTHAAGTSCVSHPKRQ